MSNNNPLVSITCITFNHEKFIAQALEGVLMQKTNFPIELIIGDDCSTDGTQSIIMDYHRRNPGKIKPVLRDKNVGVPKNGIDIRSRARGKYIALLEGDDYWTEKMKLQKQVEFLELNTDFSICFHHADVLENGTIKKKGYRYPPGKKEFYTELDLLEFSNFLPTSSVVFRREFIEDYPAWAYDLEIGDLPLHIIVCMRSHGKIKFIDEAWSVYRIHQGGLYGGLPQEARLKRALRVFERLRAVLPDTHQEKTNKGLALYQNQLASLNRNSAGTFRPSPLNSKIKSNTSKAKILLATSAAPDQSPFSTHEKRPPLGVGFLLSVLKNAGHQVFFIDNYLQPNNFLESDFLQRNRIDFVGIYANTICFRDTIRMLYKLDYLRISGRWKGKIIIGGPHTTVALDTIPEFVDYVVQGEGEKAILEIVDGGITGRVIRSAPIKNLDALPMPAWEHFIRMPYNWGVDWFPGKPVFTMNTSRGCPFDCAFCSVSSIWGRKYTCFSAERIVADIECLIKNYSAKGIYFREDNFTLNSKRVQTFCDHLLQKNIKIFWACESRVDTLNKKILELMYRAGARAFYFGVESGSQRVLNFLKKGITVDRIRETFKLCHDMGFKTAASIITGIPNESEEDVKQTESLIKEINPDLIWKNVFVGIPNSDLYKWTLKEGYDEFIDDRGLVYLKGHNDRVKRYYSNAWDASIPVSFDYPKISVIMSVFNGGEYIESSIKSILNQTYPNFEFIIVNDGSMDETEKRLEKYHDPRIKIVQNSGNLGLTKSLNKGIQAARGEYIARMDADDLSYPHRFEIQLKFLENNKEYALVGSSYYRLDKNGKKEALINVLTEDAGIREGLRQQNWFGHGSVMMRKDAVQEVGGYDERFKFSQDYDLWLRISERYKVANIDEPLYGWRVSRGCISLQKAEEQKKYAEMAISEADKRIGSKLSIEKVNPMVSVIVPTYNRPATLAETLKSVLNQSYKNFEIVVVNDAGTAVEKVIYDLNENQNIHYIKHDRNRGLAAARNTGLKIARGKYISYLDDDDLLLTEHLETLVGYLENHEEQVAYTDAYRAFQEKVDGKYVVTKKDLPYSFDFDYDRILGDNFIPVLCVMHAKSCLDAVGYFDESLKKLEDWDLWIRMSRNFKFAHIKKVTCEFAWRDDGSTMTSGKWPEFQEARKAISAKYKNDIKKTSPSHAFSKPSKCYVPSLVSIIILTFNQVRYTRECLDSIRKHTPEPHEIIFIDNGSTDGTVQELRKLIKENPNYKLVENGKNLGFAKGCNQGILKAAGEYILLLNNDVVVPVGWLSGLLECLQSAAKIGIVGPMTNNISGIQKVSRVPYKSIKEFDAFAQAFRDKNRNRHIPSRRIVGFCMLFHQNLVEQIGLLDESFGTGNYEDDDFCLRAELADFTNLIAGDVFIHHYGSRSFTGNGIDYSGIMSGNRRYFDEKWDGKNYESIPGKKLLSLKAKEMAKSLYERDQVEKAVQKYLAAIHFSPQEKSTYYDLVDMFIDAKGYDKATQVLGELPDVDRDDFKQAYLGYCFEGLGKTDQAEECAEKALAIQPANTSALNLKGKLAYRKGNFDSAKEFFDKAIITNPGYGEPYTNLGVLKWEAGEREEALSLMEKGFILSPTDSDILEIFHSAVTELGKFASAEEAFHAAKNLHPGHKRIRFFLVDILLKQEKYAEAILEIEEMTIAFEMGEGLLEAALEVRSKIGPKEIKNKGNRSTLSLCMIVKDEEKYLGKCLHCVGNLVDEMIVVDTGSTDRTKEIATAFGAKVFDFPWSNDFSAARNFSLSEAKGNWILVLDADELISPIDHPALLNLIKIHGKKVAYSFVTRNYVEKVDVVTWSPNDGKYEEESGSGWIPSEKVRLFPNDDRVQFENPVHEFVEHSLEKISTLIKKCSIPIHHYGKLNEDKEKKKGEHYYLLGKKKLEKSESDIQSIGELAVQAGGLNQFEEAIKLWNRYLTLQPEVPEPYINLSAIYMKMGKYQEAAEYSKKAMALSPETKEGVMNYSLAEFNLGHIEKTICALEDLLSKNPEYPLALGLLSVAYIIHGEKEKSQPIIEKIRRMGFNYDQYLHNTARELLSLGREEHARWLMDIAGEDNNNNLMVKDQQPINLCEKASGSKSHLKRSNRVETERSS